MKIILPDDSGLLSDFFSTTITNNFARYGYFAVSALGCDVEEISDGSGTSWAPISDPIPLRIEEPIFWILRQWGVIG